MTTNELFEMAALDALGLLDRDEREEFERAFRAAPPHVQAQIRREQVRFSDIDAWLPEVEPPPGLRSRVVNAVKEAITSIHEPAGRITPGASWLNTTAFWRAACIGFATATVFLSGFVYTVAQRNKEILRAAINNSLESEIQEFGREGFAEVITSPNLVPVAFTPPAPDADVRSQANLFIDTESKRAYLMCHNLPIASGEYTLVIGADKGAHARRIERFRVDSDLLGLPLDAISVEDLGRLEIRSPRRAGGRTEVILIGGQA